MPDPVLAAGQELRFKEPMPLMSGYTVADSPVPTYFFVAATAPPTRTDAEERQRLHKLDVAERRQFANEIAKAAYQLPGVTEVWLTGIDDELVVAVLSDARDMQRDLELQRLAIGVSQQFPHVRWTLETREHGETDSEESGELLPA